MARGIGRLLLSRYGVGNGRNRSHWEEAMKRLAIALAATCVLALAGPALAAHRVLRTLGGESDPTRRCHKTVAVGSVRLVVRA